jgi:hypothetical protein
VWNTVNGGGNWTNVTGTLPVRWVTHVTCDPFNTSRAFVTLSGYRYHDNMKHVYMTTNNGTTWTDIAGNLPDVPCSDIIADPAADSLLYLANDVGVYFTRDMGSSWNLLGTGMPTLVCSDLTLHAGTHTLLAATYGRGMYKMDLSAALGTEELNAESLILKVYPNPASDYVVISTQSSAGKKINVTFTNIQGKKVYEAGLNTSNAKHEAKIDVSGFAKGIYLVSVTIEGRKKVEKIVVE